MTDEDFKEISGSLPKEPGVYRFLNHEGKVIYVGKAKSLRSRLSSYFGEKKQQYFKTITMLKNAHHIEYTIVESEQDALLLENTLIKQIQPRYNVLLKDDKSYSFICIKNERFPRVFLTRRVIRDGSTYFGPYTSKARVKEILEIVKKLFPLRTCVLNLSPQPIAAGKYKVCLEYHIKNCLGPCEGLESEESYNMRIEQIRNILKGHFREVIAHLKSQMEKFATEMEFEKAQQIKEKLTLFEDYQARSTVVSQFERDLDVFSIATDETHAYVNYLKVVQGAIINSYTQELQKNLDEDEEQLLSFTIDRLREKFNSITEEIVIPMKVTLVEQGITQTVPQRGEKKELLDLSLKNVRYFLLQKQKEKMNNTKQTPSERILGKLQQDLRMKEVPMHIECFDNSNFQGTSPVASCVVFKNARPAKRDYRHFHVKTVEGPDDFASMREIVERRYKRMLEENQALPNLVVIDGGKGQLSAAMEAISLLGIRDKMTVIGIAKKLEEIYFPGDSIPLYIDKKSESLRLIQQIRNEAHRFAITFHRNTRSKNFTNSELTAIKGIGEKTAEKLLKYFGSVKKLKVASEEEIIKVVGQAAAKKIVFEKVPIEKPEMDLDS
ncbi:MAG: excinuclease ABC subunit C [Saprospiraceae bacterium]|uniref:UvrABC system protein C n=1 Tax=Candidatus Opimibacter skivensis TaxID=2982028 RepID=A0A9D7XRT6_9BACT|nr:excinuclease ABC subunit C [Candidatus Opimibacter skivensis]